MASVTLKAKVTLFYSFVITDYVLKKLNKKLNKKCVGPFLHCLESSPISSLSDFSWSYIRYLK